MIKFTIPLEPRTKKNHSQISCMPSKRCRKPCGKIPINHPSKEYQEYARKCKKLIKSPIEPIDGQINLKAVFYMQTRRRVDLVNLLQALCDILVDCGYIVDDNCKVIVSLDGSRVGYDKMNPRTEVEIREIEKEIDK